MIAIAAVYIAVQVTSIEILETKHWKSDLTV